MDKIIRSLELEEEVKKEIQKAILTAGGKNDEKLNKIRSLGLKEEVKKELGVVIKTKIEDYMEKLGLIMDSLNPEENAEVELGKIFLRYEKDDEKKSEIIRLLNLNENIKIKQELGQLIKIENNEEKLDLLLKSLSVKNNKYAEQEIGKIILINHQNNEGNLDTIRSLKLEGIEERIGSIILENINKKIKKLDSAIRSLIVEDKGSEVKIGNAISTNDKNNDDNLNTIRSLKLEGIEERIGSNILKNIKEQIKKLDLAISSLKLKGIEKEIGNAILTNDESSQKKLNEIRSLKLEGIEEELGAIIFRNIIENKEKLNIVIRSMDSQKKDKKKKSKEVNLSDTMENKENLNSLPESVSFKKDVDKELQDISLSNTPENEEKLNLIIRSFDLKHGVEKELGELMLSMNNDNLDSTSSKKSDSIKIEDLETNELKIILINAFIISVLDKEEHYKAYITELSKALEKADISPEYTKKEEKNEFQEFYKAIKTKFPFSNLNKPPTNIILPSYNRTKGSFDYAHTFSDCADITILNLCICLFWDHSTESFSVERLKLDGDSELKKFFDKYSKNMFPITHQMRNDWSRVIQDLPNGSSDTKINDANVKFKPLAIEYVSKFYRNEVETGIINMMSILVNICHTESNKIKEEYIKLINKDEITEDNIANLFEELLNILANKLKYHKVEVKSEENTIREIKTNRVRTDFKGVFKIEFSIDIGEKDPWTESMRLDIKNGHSEITYMPKNTEVDQKILDKFENILKNKELTTFKFLIKSYIYYLVNKEMDYPEDINSIQSLYLYAQGPLYNNDEKKNCLLKLTEIAHNNDGSNEFKEEAKTVGENILRSAILSDEGTKEILLPFYYLCNELLLKLTDEEKCDTWKRVYDKTREKHSTGLKDSWSKIMKNENITCEQLELNMNRCFEDDNYEKLEIAASSLKKLSIEYYKASIAEKICNFILKKLGNEMPCLESLVFRPFGPWGTRNIDEIKKILDKHPSIKSLEFSSCTLDSSVIKHISNIFIKNYNLKALSFVNVEFSDDKNTAITAIRDDLMDPNCKLESFSLRSIKLKENQIKLLSEALEKNNSLKSLSLRSVSLRLSLGINSIAEALRKNNTLEILDLSENQLDNSSIKLILDALKGKKIFKSLNLSKNQLDNSSIDFILNGLKDNQPLEFLHISFDSLVS